MLDLRKKRKEMEKKNDGDKSRAVFYIYGVSGIENYNSDVQKPSPFRGFHVRKKIIIGNVVYGRSI